ncbi:MAG: hypothetical protein GX922_02305 [Firmicutes bacterium]|jgi:hypothetical protein|nr:hypothetical protein [Bacillota bacterium]
MEKKDWIILGLLVLIFSIRWLTTRTSRITGKKPGKSQGKAVQILEDAGYEIITAKPTLAVKMEIDEQQHIFDLKNDFLVKRDGKRYLVHIRRDTKPVRLQSKLWRSSLLRDVLAFRVNGMLILHLEKGTLQEVRFRI